MINHNGAHYIIAFVLTAMILSLGLKVAMIADRRPVVINASGPTRHAPLIAWGELGQAEIDAITAKLNAGAAPKKPVLIVCADHNCEDLALDLENAFESAHWETSSDKPLLDSLVGVHVASPDNDAATALAAALEAAVDHRFTVATIAPNFKEDRYALVISKKPR